MYRDYSKASISILAIALVLSYASEYLRIKSHGYWPKVHAGVVQLFIPNREKAIAVSTEDNFDQDNGLSNRPKDRSSGLLIPCFVVTGFIYSTDLLFNSFGGAIENMLLSLFRHFQ
jgi:hypothetical protein